jgi:WD40 repeat protein
MRKLIASLFVVCGLVVYGVTAHSADEKPAKKAGVIEAAAVNLGRPVDFDRDILPIFESSCIACHNIAIDEGKLSLEDVESVMKGGKRGPIIVPKQPEKSRLFLYASHAAKPSMPPMPNKVDAATLTPKQLGLIRQWILEGATKGMGASRQSVQWRPLPSTLKSIYSVALSPWGRFAAAGRTNQISVYDLSSKQEVARLVDPALATVEYDGGLMYPGGAAHRDFVNSLAFSPDGNLLASGGYRVVKLWKRVTEPKRFALPLGQDVTAVAISADGKLAAIAAADKTVRLWNLVDGKPGATLSGHTDRITGLEFWPRAEEQAAVSRLVTTTTANIATTNRNLATAKQAAADFAAHPDPKLDEAATKAKQTQLAAAQTAAEAALKAAGAAATAATTASAAFDKKAAEQSRLFTVSADKTVRIWKASDGSAIAQLQTPAAINDVATNLDGSRFVTAEADNTLRVWAFPIVETKPADGEKKDPAKPAVVPVSELKGHTKPVTSVDLVFTPGTQIVSGSTDGTIRTWDLAGAKQIRSMNHGGPVMAVAARADGLRLASVSDNGIGKLWETSNGKQLAELKSDVKLQRQVTERVEEQAVSKQRVALADAAFKAADKNLKDREAAAKKATDAKTAADKAIADPDKKNKDADAKLKAAKTAQETAAKDLKAAQDAATKSAAERDAATKKAAADAVTLKASQAAATVAAKTSADAEAALKKATDAKAAADKGTDDNAKAAAAKALTDAQAAAKTAADGLAAAKKAATDAEAIVKASTDAKTKADALAKTNDAAAKAADAKSKASVKPTQAAEKAFAATQVALKKVMDAAAQALRSLNLSQKAIVTAKAQIAERTKTKDAETASQKLADADVVKAQAAEKAVAKPLRTVAFSLDGTQVVTSGDNAALRSWDATTGLPLDAYVAHQGPVTAIAFSATGTIVTGANDKTASAWSAAPQWKLVGQLGANKENPLDLAASPFINRILTLDFSSDGKLLATGGGDPSRSGELMIWDVEKQQLVRTIEDAHSDTVMGVEFSRDGRTLVSGAADKFVKTFDVATGKHIRSYEGHTHHVLDVSIKGDESTIISAGADNVIKVWNTETGEQRRTISTYKKQVVCVQYIAATDNFVSCSGDKTVRLFTAANGSNRRSFTGGGDFMYAAACSRDEAIVLGGGEDGVLRVWNGKNGQVIAAFEPPQPVVSDAAIATAGK